MNISALDKKITKVNQNNNQYKKDKAQERTKGKRNNTSFDGASDVAFDVLDKCFKVLDKNAMIQVSVVDTVSTNIPRTLVDLKTGLAAAFETFRREFSGLFVNCLMPGLIVGLAAFLFPKNNILKNTNVVSSWANGASIDRLKTVYNEAQNSGASDKTKEFVERTLKSIEGLDGTTWVKYSDSAENPAFQEAVSNITQAINGNGVNKKSLIKSAKEKLAGLTKAEGILKFNGQAASNLEETLRDTVDMGSKFNTAVKNNISIDEYSEALKKFVNKKSIIGLLVVFAIAVSIQTINRAITRKQFNAEGAPIYKDFGKKDTTQKMDEKQKKKFRNKKILSAAGMYGIAALSMMKKPTLGMFQFSNIFPTLDQCRWIAASTFASRMLGAEDENELRETTVRDIASFSGLYFLGDYVKKAAASAIEGLSKTKNGAKLVGENVVLLNRKKEIAKPVMDSASGVMKNIADNTAYRFKQFGNWIKNTELKTAAEVSSKNVRNLRNICRVCDIAFSIIMLGVLLPKYNRKVTEKKVEEAKKREEMQRQTLNPALRTENIPKIFKDIA